MNEHKQEVVGDCEEAIERLDWSQLEFGIPPDTEDMVSAVMAIVWQAAIDFIYQQPMTLNRDTLIERMKRWMESGADVEEQSNE